LLTVGLYLRKTCQTSLLQYYLAIQIQRNTKYWQSLTTVILLVLNRFMNKRLTVKSRDYSSALFGLKKFNAIIIILTRI